MPNYPELEGYTVAQALNVLQWLPYEIQAEAIIDYSIPLKDPDVQAKARLIASEPSDTKWIALLRVTLQEFDKEMERKPARPVGGRRRSPARIGRSFSIRRSA